MSTTTTPDIQRIRAAFPALSSSTILLENAGGSQVPKVVADRIRDYMLGSYVQLDASYEMSRTATETVERAHDFVNLLMNGHGAGRVMLGPSCTAICNMLAGCYAKRMLPGDEVVIAQSGHEANVGPWARLGDAGFTVKTWAFDPDQLACTLEQLEPLLSERTRVVAFPHVSNLLGEIVDIRAITDLVHRAGARVVADGVAYAPHRAIDVRDWGVDWYVYSAYKVYGPHMAAMFGTDESFAELEGTGPNHFFIADDAVPYKYEPGGVSHEGCAGLLALGEYLLELTDRPAGSEVDRGVVTEAFDIMTACERPPTERLIDWLNGRDDIRIVGPAHAGPSRVGTISFVHETLPSRQIADFVNTRGIGIRNGHMYAARLCDALGLSDLEDGVVRVSLVHYNTVEEIDRLIEVLEAGLAEGCPRG